MPPLCPLEKSLTHGMHNVYIVYFEGYIFVDSIMKIINQSFCY